MRTRNLCYIALFMLATGSIIMTVQAFFPTYSITSNWHGTKVPIGSTVTVTAVTTDSTIHSVIFIWKNATSNVIYTDVVAPLTRNGSLYVAASTHVVANVGGWSVKAIFQSLPRSCRIVIKATSFAVIRPTNQVPEIPVLGTAGAVAVMLLGLGLYLFKTRKSKPSFSFNTEF